MDGEILNTFDVGPPLSSYVIGSKGQFIATGHKNGDIQIWTENGYKLRELKGYITPVTGLAFSADRRFLLSVAEHDSVKMWNLQSGNHITFLVFSSGEWIVYDENGYFDSSDKGQEYIRLIKGLTVLPAQQRWKELHRPGLFLDFIEDESAQQLDIAKIVQSAPAIADDAALEGDTEKWGKYSLAGATAFRQRNYREALTKFEAALKEAEAFGEQDTRLAFSLNDLAQVFRIQSRHTEAESLYRRALAIWEKAHGSESTRLTMILDNLSRLYLDQGRYAEAEALLQRALAIAEKAQGPEHWFVATRLSNLAWLYSEQGRYAEAEPLLKRVLAIRVKEHGPEHPDVATTLDSLAALYYSQGLYAEAKSQNKRTLTLREEVLPDHPHVATSLTNLADLYRSQHRYAEAESLLKRALAILEMEWLAAEQRDVATGLTNLADLYRSQHRYAEAEPLYKRALALWEKTLGPEHPQVAKGLNNLALLSEAQGRLQEASGFTRRAVTIHRSRIQRNGGSRSSGSVKNHQGVRSIFLHHVSLLHRLAAKQPSGRPALTAEGLTVSQLASTTGAAQALSRMAARYGTGDDALADLVRERQDARNRWQLVDAELVHVIGLLPGQRNKDKEQQLHDELKVVDEEISKLDRTLAEQFPEYAELVNPKPLSPKEAQALLEPDEALLAFLVGEEESFLWVVRKDKLAMHRLDVGKEALDRQIKSLRRVLDPSGIRDLAELRPFAVTHAHALYQTLLRPAEPLLEGASQLLLIPDGALQSLPFGVLLTEKPPRRIDKLEDYRDLSWLAQRYALTVLPSVSSLRALRRFAKGSPAPEPFVGFGDPLLDGKAGDDRGIDVAMLFPRGNIADVDQVRRMTQLPDTAHELRAMAKALGGDQRHTYLGEQATEGRVKTENLAPFRVVAFATHGLMAGEFQGLSEPALVLTPPIKGTQEDDGLLTASEAAQLKLNADWVVLSACNTAAPDGGPGAEGLSGLAKAFFYAGSRALLVSHWAVSSDAAVALTKGLFQALQDDPAIGRSEALRRSMGALMNDKEKPWFAHPMFWAPFFVVGEGGAVAAR